MAKYKLINQNGYSSEIIKLNGIYDESYDAGGCTVAHLVRSWPNDWELVPEEKLPEKWCVCPQTDDNLALIKKWSGQFDNHRITHLYNAYTNDKKYYSTVEWAIRSGYSPITFNQFKRLVLEEESMKEKEIIGYKAPFDFTGTTDFVHKGDVFTREGTEFFYTNNGLVKKKNKLPAQIVEQWEPVYKESHPDITINGYKGEFFDNYVRFGCAEISHKYFCDIYNLIFKTPKGTETNREIESVTIGKGTFTKEQIKEIAEYYISKK